MLSHMDPYSGIVVFELEASPMAAPPSFSAKIFISSMQTPKKKHMHVLSA